MFNQNFLAYKWNDFFLYFELLLLVALVVKFELQFFSQQPIGRFQSKKNYSFYLYRRKFWFTIGKYIILFILYIYRKLSICLFIKFYVQYFVLTKRRVEFLENLKTPKKSVSLTENSTCPSLLNSPEFNSNTACVSNFLSLKFNGFCLKFSMQI